MRFLLYIAIIGLAVYILIALIQRRGRRSGGSSPRPGSRPTPGPRPGRPVAPDDDPAFLADLDRRRRAAERKAAESGGAKDGASPAEEPRASGAGTPADPAPPSGDAAGRGDDASSPSDDASGKPAPQPDGTASDEPDGDSPGPDDTPADPR